MLVPTERVSPSPNTSATDGQIRWVPLKSLWFLAHLALGGVGVFAYPSWGGAAAFLGLAAITLCAGHSVGMHRLLIHHSFQTHRWLFRILVWLGTCVGMAGPFGMIRAHDMRDWDQRQVECPPHPSHAAGFWRDAWWQLCCDFRLTRPPRFTIEPDLANDPVLIWIERTWMAQQLALAVPLYLWGGVGFVLWGISVRIAVSLFGHWLVGHFAHRRGHQGWRITGLPVQGYDLPGLGVLTFGENWHGNHHAFPHSAQLGLEPGQRDPGFWLIRGLQAVGLVWNVKGPASEPARDGLARVAPQL